MANRSVQNNTADETTQNSELTAEIARLKNKVQALEQQMEQQIKENNSSLKQHINTLKDTQHQLVQTAKLASMGQLTAGLAHELNQPLGRILLTAELALSKLQRSEFSKQIAISNYLERIMADVQSATVLINHLKTYSHQDVQSVVEPFDIKWLIEEAMILFNHRIDIKGVEFKMQFEHQDQTLKGDQGQISQVFNNLLGNALDALAQTPSPCLQVSTYDDGKYCCVAIKDNGSGMDEATAGNIFDPFFTTKRSGEGTGLGLSISRGIMQGHNGKLTVDSVEDQGSCFIIWLLRNQENRE